MSHFNNVNVGVTGFVFDSRYTFTGLGYLAVCWQKQWGENVGGGGQTVSLPISFEVAFTAVVSADSSWCNASCHITTTTITTMNYQSNRPDIAQAGPVQWLAIGIQPQWGIVYAEQGYIIVTLPLAYSSNKYVVIGQDLDYTSNDTDGYGENVGVTQVTTTSIRVSITRGRYLSYCTIGF